jgi:thiamine-phosphate pyrophosphorylase
MDPTLYVILDRSAGGGRDILALLEAAIQGGSRMIQLREKEWPSGRVFPLAERIAARCREAGVTFILNDRVDLAIAVGAHGVHLGQEDLPPAAARRMLPRGAVLGLSTHSLEQAKAAVAAGADYVAVGSIFPTGTKPNFQLVGPELIRSVRSHVPVPLVGIGGITPDNVAEVIRAGADGVAVISAVCGAADPAGAAARFLAAIRAARSLTGPRPPL